MHIALLCMLTHPAFRVHVILPLLHMLLVEHCKAPCMRLVPRPLLGHFGVVVDNLRATNRQVSDEQPGHNSRGTSRSTMKPLMKPPGGETYHSLSVGLVPSYKSQLVVFSEHKSILIHIIHIAASVS